MADKADVRRYLKQLRELGEADLVLEGMLPREALNLIRTSGASVWRETLRQSGVDVEPEAVLARSSRTPSSPEPDMKLKKGKVVDDESELFDGPIAKLDSLKAIADKVKLCKRCSLYETATHGVPGEGNPKARVVCVGEGPGATEDETGLPFVGAAGALLTKILASVDLTREEVFITNVVKHRPPGNRNPQPDEVEACTPYLTRQLELIKPKVIIAFGNFAAQTLLNTKDGIGKLRGFIHTYHGTPLVVTYHPAALLRNQAWKRPTWEDVKLARRVLDSAAGA